MRHRTRIPWCATRWHQLIVLFWNQEFHNVRGFTSRETAEAWGYALHDILQQDALAGALLGYDADVLDRLQAQCSA